jgi:hypothetical protein
MPNRTKKDKGSNRRRWTRLDPENLSSLKKVEFNRKNMQIIDISQGGLLLETEIRLRPDMTIMLKLVTTEGILKIDGKILRSTIHSLKGVPKYRSAITFHNPLELLDDIDVERGASSEQNSTGVTAGHEDSVESQPAGDYPDNEERPAVLTVVASDASGICLEESFELDE